MNNKLENMNANEKKLLFRIVKTLIYTFIIVIISIFIISPIMEWTHIFADFQWGIAGLLVGCILTIVFCTLLIIAKIEEFVTVMKSTK